MTSETIRKRNVNRPAETANKRAERLRRKEAGYKRVECWLSAEDFAWVTQIGTSVPDGYGKFTVADTVSWCVRTKRVDSEK